MGEEQNHPRSTLMSAFLHGAQRLCKISAVLSRDAGSRPGSTAALSPVKAISISSSDKVMFICSSSYAFSHMMLYCL